MENPFSFYHSSDAHVMPGGQIRLHETRIVRAAYGIKNENAKLNNTSHGHVLIMTTPNDANRLPCIQTARKFGLVTTFLIASTEIAPDGENRYRDT